MLLDPNRSVLLLVDEIVSYEYITAAAAEAQDDPSVKIPSYRYVCLSTLCKLLDYYSTCPRTYMIVTSLRQICDKSGSLRPLEWAKLDLLGHFRSDGSVDFTEV